MFFTILSTFKVNLNIPTLSKVDLILSKKYDFISLRKDICKKKLSYCKINEINFKLKPKTWLKKKTK